MRNKINYLQLSLIIVIFFTSNWCRADDLPGRTLRQFTYEVKQGDTSYSLQKFFCTYFPQQSQLKYGTFIDIHIPYEYVYDIMFSYIKEYNKRLTDTQVTEIVDAILWQSYIKDLPPCLVLGIIAHESKFKPTAIGPTKDYGLMQISNMNATRMNIEVKDLLHNIKYNIIIGTNILKFHNNYFSMSTWWVTYNIGLRTKLIKNGVDLGAQYQSRVQLEINNIATYFKLQRQKHDRRGNQTNKKNTSIETKSEGASQKSYRK